MTFLNKVKAKTMSSNIFKLRTYRNDVKKRNLRRNRDQDFSSILLHILETRKSVVALYVTF